MHRKNDTEISLPRVYIRERFPADSGYVKINSISLLKNLLTNNYTL